MDDKPAPVIITPAPAEGKKLADPINRRKTVAPGSAFTEEDLARFADYLAIQAEARRREARKEAGVKRAERKRLRRAKAKQRYSKQSLRRRKKGK